MTKRQLEVMNLDLTGKTTKEIAKALGISRQAIECIKSGKKYKLGIVGKRPKPPELPKEVIISAAQIEKQRLAKVRTIETKLIKAEIKKALDPVIKVWKEGALPAAEKIVQLSQFAKEETLQFQASKEVVSQAGYVPEKKVTTMSVELSGQDAERISQAFKFSQTRTREIADTGE